MRPRSDACSPSPFFAVMPSPHGVAVRALLLLTLLLGAGCGSDVDPDGARATAPPEAAAPAERTILFLGDSITAGLGIGPEQAFPALIQARIDSLGLDYRVVNAGVSGETSAGGLRRIDWVLRRPADIVVIELGANDGLRGTPVETTRANLQAIIDSVRARQPEADIVLAGMQVPPNLGADYTEAFREIYPGLARENDLALIPFVLEGVGGVRRLNLPDGIHPTAEGHRIVAENVWRVLAPLLEARAEDVAS